MSCFLVLRDLAAVCSWFDPKADDSNTALLKEMIVGVLVLFGTLSISSIFNSTQVLPKSLNVFLACGVEAKAFYSMIRRPKR